MDCFSRRIPGGEPTGALIPTGDGILYTKDGVVIWNQGIVGYLSTRGQQDEWTRAELDGYNQVYDALRGNQITSDIWGCLIKFFPVSSPAQEMFVQLPFAEINVNLAKVKFQFSASQIVLLDEQLMYWRNRFDVAYLVGDYDDCEFCSLYVVAIDALILV